MSAPIPTVEQLLRRYPEFAGASLDYPNLVADALSEAAAETSDWAFPSVASQLAYSLMKAAVLLYESPFAREMRLDSAGAPKVSQLQEMLRRKGAAAVMGLRVF